MFFGNHLSKSLTSKLSVRVASVVMLLLLGLGIYFDFFLRSSFLESTNQRMQHAAQRLALNLAEIESNLRQATQVATVDERLIASIELINKYQDKNNYNRFLIDEEKKTLAQGLLDRLKLTASSDIALFGEQGALIAYAIAREDGYRMGYQSVVGGQDRIFERKESAADYRDIGKSLEIPGNHINYYVAEDLLRGSVITYHRARDALVVKSHQNMHLNPGGNAIGQIEMSQTLDPAYFSTVARQLDLGIRLYFDDNSDEVSAHLESARELGVLKTRDVDDHYLTVLEKTALGGPAYLAITLDRATHSAIVTQNRLRFLALLGLLSIATLLWMRHVATTTLARPLDLLMEQIRGVEHGDYATKGHIRTGDELEEISRSVNLLASAVHDRESSLEKSRHEQEFLSNHDSLTGLPNRRFFSYRLEHALDLARRSKNRLAVLFLDLDQFKLVNDTLGHDVGDALLMQVGARLASHLRSSDTLARIGGDEFNVLIEGFDDPSEVEAVVTKFIHLFQDPFACNGRKINITVSIGIAMYPDDGTDSVTLHKHADLAVYKSKAQGRDGFSFYSEDLSRETQQRAEAISAISAALESGNQFYMVYQPKCDPNTGQVLSAEALIRWNRPGYGNVPPLQFIPLAEETGQIMRIGDWVTRQVCKDIAQLRGQGVELSHVSLNVSNAQLRGHDFLQVLLDSVSACHLDPSVLELEITESYISEDTTEAINALHAFKNSGFKLAIDDFGTGYSSMSSLQRLPFSRLKVDKSFVDGLPDEPNSVSIVRAIMGLAKNFGLSITAEGVELAGQLEFLRAEGCDEIQGFYFSKPLSLHDLKQFALQRRG